MRVPQEKREPYAVHFVSANKHATVYHRYAGQVHKISQIRISLIFVNFRKYAKFLARSKKSVSKSLKSPKWQFLSFKPV